MERLDECRKLYFKLTNMEFETKLFPFNTKREDRDWASLKENLRDALSTLHLGQKFRHSIFDSLLHEKEMKNQPKLDYKLVARAFGHLETYCRLLKIYPWKTEYHTLKTYGGFFRTYIYSALPSCVMILNILGYSSKLQGIQAGGPGASTVLKLNSLPNTALLETIGFDCLVASLECENRFEAMDFRPDAFVNRTVEDSMRRRLDLLNEIKMVSSLPRELELYPSNPRRSHLIRAIAKSRTYHFEKLNLYQKRRNMFSDDDSDYYGVNFSRDMGCNTEKVGFTTPDEKSSTN